MHLPEAQILATRYPCFLNPHRRLGGTGENPVGPWLQHANKYTTLSRIIRNEDVAPRV